MIRALENNEDGKPKLNCIEERSLALSSNNSIELDFESPNNKEFEKLEPDMSVEDVVLMLT